MIEDEEPLKKCSICGELKPFSEFSKNKRSKDGLQSQCKICRKEYYENNKEKILEYQKEYRENNKEQLKEYHKKYYKNNKDRIKKYREDNKEKIKKYRENNKDRIKEYHKEYCKNINNNKRKTISASFYKHRKRGYCIIVTIDECMEMDTDYCYYCGCKLEWEYGTGASTCSPTIDRLNNENILTKDNIVFACIACNAGKHSGTPEEYIERCKRVVANENNILRK